jgi:hypothetical protein
MSKILIFTGAGFSVPLDLPITTGFTNLINKCPNELKNHLTAYLEKGFNDIEKFISTLESFANERSLSASIISSMTQTNGNFGAVNNHINNLKAQSRNFILQVKSGIYDLLSNFDRDNSRQIYLNLLGQVRAKYSDARISIFTTNYDLTFENTVYNYRDEIVKAGYRDIIYGFTPSFGTFAFDPKQEFKWESDLLEYIKLHGSLDWQPDQNVICTKSGTSTKPADPNQSPLLYPGFKEIPATEPFVSFHERLIARLSEATEVIVIGFAFRDPYLNSIFEFFLRTTKANLFCFNPANINDLPEESAIRTFSQQFKKFHYVQKGIEIRNEPLEF